MLGERERLLNAHTGPPEHDDHGSHAPAVTVIGGVAHDRDDLVDGGWVSGVVQALVAGRPAGVVAGQRGRRATPSCRVER
jgi:hypothetical protein